MPFGQLNSLQNQFSIMNGWMFLYGGAWRFMSLIIALMTPDLPFPFKALVLSANTLHCSNQWRKVNEDAHLKNSSN